MKFKKSHILMISLISLFLMLAMSAVSAASDADVLAQDMAIDDITAVEDIDVIEEDPIDANALDDGENPANPDNPGTGDGEGDETGTPTTIVSGNETYSFGSDMAFDVSVMDNDNSINVSEDNLKVSYKKLGDENFTEMNFTLNNESKIVFKFDKYKTLPVGDYIVKIQFLGATIDDVRYLANETEVTLNITKSDTNITANDTKVALDKDVIIPIVIKLESNKTLNVNKANITVVYNNGEEVWEYAVTNGTGGFNVTNDIKLIGWNITTVGNYSITILFHGTGNCNPSNTTITLSILENNTIKTNDTVKVNNSNKTVTIPFAVVNNEIVNVTNPETQENSTELNVTNLTVNNQDLKLVVVFDNGTENKTIVLDENSFHLDGETGNQTLTFDVSEIDFSKDYYNAELTVIYMNGTLNETRKTINLTAFEDVYLIPIVNETDYQFGQFKYQLVDGNNQPLVNCTVSVSGLTLFKITENGGISTYYSLTSDDEGNITFNNTLLHDNIMTGLSMMLTSNFTSLPAGTYNITLSTSGFYHMSNKTEIKVNPINAKIIADNIVDEYGKILKYTVQLVREGTNEPIKASNVQFHIVASNIDAVREAATNLTGYYTSPDLNLSAGTYNLTLKSLDDSLNCSEVKKNLTLNKRNAILSASNRTIYYNSDYSAIVTLTDKKTGNVVANAYVLIRVYTTSKDYTDFLGKTDSNGKIYLSTPLAVGKHKITFTCADNNYNASSITRYLTVKKASAKLTANKVTTYYRSGKNFQVKLINTKTNKPIYYGTVNIKVYITKNRYYNITGVTDGNGIVRLKINFKPGTYKVVVSSADKGYTAKSVTSQIKVTKAPIKMAPTALKVKKGKYFKVKVTSTKSKKVLSGVKVKVKVYTGKKYKTYTIKTNKKGIASLKIKQKVGKHKVILTPATTKYYTGKKVTKTLKVTK